MRDEAREKFQINEASGHKLMGGLDSTHPFNAVNCQR